MSIAEFIAIDPYAPQNTEKELEGFIPRFKGMLDWEIYPDGEVVIQYDDTRISDELIEEVLERNGFTIQHILDLPVSSDVQAFKAFYLRSGLDSYWIPLSRLGVGRQKGEKKNEYD